MKRIHFWSIPEYLQYQESLMLDPLKMNWSVLIPTNTGTRQPVLQCSWCVFRKQWSSVALKNKPYQTFDNTDNTQWDEISSFAVFGLFMGFMDKRKNITRLVLYEKLKMSVEKKHENHQIYSQR